jgi:glycosyltransferase involved in cell wall biosynthesis
MPTTARGDKILMLGRVDDPAKGLGVLLRALEILRQKGVDPRLIVTGDDRFGPGVDSGGWISYSDIPNLYQMASVVVVPSLWDEPFGLVAAEAAACGVPVVASRNGGLASIVKDGETGFLVTPGDEKELAARIELLLRDRQLRDRQGLAARAHAEEFFDWDRIVEDYHLPMIDEDV